MTGPYLGSDLARQYGPGSDFYQSLLDAYNSGKDERLSDPARNANGYPPQPIPQPQYSTTHAAPPVTPDWKDEDLVGAAVYWGIPAEAARSMPRQVLIDTVNEYTRAARSEQSGPMNVATSLLSIPAQFATGIGQAITGGLQRLPVVGETLSRQEWLQNADLKMRELEAGVRASTPQGMQALESVAHGSGHLAALWYPGAAAWAVAGKAGRIIPFLAASRTAMTAFQGGASAYLLEGGSDAFKEHPALMLGGGAVLGVAGERLLPPALEAAFKLKQRVTDRFVTRPQQGPYPSGAVQGPWTSGAEQNVPGKLEALAAAADGGDQQAAEMLELIRQQRAARRAPPVAGQPESGIPELDIVPPEIGLNTRGPARVELLPEEVALLDEFGPSTAILQRRLNMGYEQAAQKVEQYKVELIGYHGTDRLFKNIKTPAFFAADAENAASYARTRAEDGEGFVREARIRLKNPAPSSVVEEVALRMTGDADAILTEEGGVVIAELKRMGYDGATSYDLNNETGDVFESYIAFKSKQVEFIDGLTARQAEASAVQLNKAATITQSPEFPSIAGQADLDDLAVVRAAEATAPGGANIMQGITDPAAFVTNLGGAARIVSRPGSNRLDALVGVTDEQAGQYVEMGVFTGQRVTVGDTGIEGRITGFHKNGSAYVKPVSGPPRLVKAADLHPSLTNPQVAEVPQLWDAFESYVGSRVLQVAQAMGGDGLSPAQLQTVKFQNQQKYLEEFLTDLNITNPADRAAIEGYFNQRYIESFKMQAPIEAMQSEAAIQHMDEVLSRVEQPVIQDLDAQAATKGFVVIPEKGGITLKDIDSPAKVEFDSPASARAWVTQLNRDLPDITPASEVPIEVAGVLPREPLQAPNTNASAIDVLAEAVNDISGGIPTAGGPPPAALAGDGNVGRLYNEWTNGALKWMPMRRFFSHVDEVMHQEGFTTGMAADADGLSLLTTQHHNNMHDPMNDLTDLTRLIKTNRLVTGEWGRLWMMGSGREAAAKAAGLPEAEIAAFKQFDDLLEKVGGAGSKEAVAGGSGSVREYMAHIAARQSDPNLANKAFDEFPQNDFTLPFFSLDRNRKLNLREFDPRFVGEAYIRSVFWQRDMAVPHNLIQQKWQQLAKDNEALVPAARFMEEYLGIAKNGYHADDDLALNTLHGILSKVMGKEVSRGQARELFNFGLNATHSGLLGYRLHVMARDALQLFFAIPRAGAELPAVMAQWMSGGQEARRAIWQEALDSGAIALQSPRMASPGAFAGELEAASEGLAARPLGWRMRVAAKITAGARDMTPEMLRDSRDSALHPMYAYGKQSELMRALTYTAGKNKAAAALETFRKTGDLKLMMKESAARTYDPAWQRQFLNIVGTGDDLAASRFLGRQLADATMFKYGAMEMPAAGRSITGRAAMQMGSYSMQYMQYLRESLGAMKRVGMETGDWSDSIRFLATFGAVTAGLEAASRETGWNFRLMNPYSGLGFTGGPAIGIVADLARGVSSTAREMQGQNALPQAAAQGLRAAGSLVSNLNPLSGALRTAEGIANAGQSPYPGRSLARLGITGEIDNTSDYSMAALPQAQAAFMESIQPMPSPMSITQQGTTNIPQQPVVDPYGMVPSSDIGAYLESLRTVAPAGSPPSKNSGAQQ